MIWCVRACVRVCVCACVRASVLVPTTPQEYCSTEFLRVSGVYWGLTAMDLMGQLHRMNKSEVVEFVKSCQRPSGGFGPTENHDAHLLYTLSAVQVDTDSIPPLNFHLSLFALSFPLSSFLSTTLSPAPSLSLPLPLPLSLPHDQVLVLYDCVEVVDVEGVVRFVKALQRPDGSFVGDKWGEWRVRVSDRRMG